MLVCNVQGPKTVRGLSEAAMLTPRRDKEPNRAKSSNFTGRRKCNNGRKMDLQPPKGNEHLIAS